MKNKLLKIALIAALVLLIPFLIGRVSVKVLDRIYPAVELPTAAERCREMGTPSRECEKAQVENATIERCQEMGTPLLECVKAQAEDVMRSLERKRAMARLAVIIVGVYYVALIAGWLILRRRKNRNKQGQSWRGDK